MVNDNFRKIGKAPDGTDIPDGLANKLFYFQDIPADDRWNGLNKRLFLSIEDFKNDLGMVFGYVMNEVMPFRLHALLRDMGETLTEKFNFTSVTDANLDLEELWDTENITFLTLKNDEIVFAAEAQHSPSARFEFGPFVSYTCDSPEQTKAVAEQLENHQNVIAIYSLLAVERDSLLSMMENGQAVWREADPEIVLHKSPYERAQRAFPHLVPPLPPNPTLEFKR